MPPRSPKASHILQPSDLCRPLGLSYAEIAYGYSRKIRHEIGGLAWLHQLQTEAGEALGEGHMADQTQSPAVASSALDLCRSACILGQVINPAAYKNYKIFKFYPAMQILIEEFSDIDKPVTCCLADPIIPWVEIEGNETLLREAFRVILRMLTPPTPHAPLRLWLGAETLPDRRNRVTLIADLPQSIAQDSVKHEMQALLFQIMQRTGKECLGQKTAERLPAISLLEVAISFYIISKHGFDLDLIHSPTGSSLEFSLERPLVNN